MCSTGGVRNWSWETYWLAGGFFSWIVAPLLCALALTENLFAVLSESSLRVLALTGLFGALWGVGGLTFGLSMRYLGMSIGYGVTLGICAVFGTLLPPLARGHLSTILATTGGKVIVAGLVVCVAGIVLTAIAGARKERDTQATGTAAAPEFRLRRGLAVAVFCGIMSACFPFGLEAAAPLGTLSAAYGTAPQWTGLPKLVVVLWGGFATNALWCLALNLRNRTLREYAATKGPDHREVPIVRNYAFCAAAGVTWYLQFFFYTQGETQMGRFGFSSWTLHMASIIIFSALWGVGLREWRGTSRSARFLMVRGVALLVLATMVVGYGNYVDSR